MPFGAKDGKCYRKITDLRMQTQGGLQSVSSGVEVAAQGTHPQHRANTELSYSWHGRCQSHILAATHPFLCHGEQRIPGVCLHVQHANYNLLRRCSIV